MTRRSIAVISGGLRQPSTTRLLADQLADAVRTELESRGSEVDVVVVELREHAHDLVNNLLTGFAPPELQHAIDDVVDADALIAVTPILSGSYSGLFKSFFDVLDKESLVDRPVLVAATGGTARHSLALEHAMRPLFAYLRSVVVPTGVFAATEDFGGSEHAALRRRIDRAARELATAVEARETSGPADPFDDVVPLRDLLSRQ